MAEQRTGNRRSSSGSKSSKSSNSGSKSNNSGSKELSGLEAVKRVRKDFPELLGRPIEAILGVERDEDENWKIIVQVVELARIPNSTDVLGAYSVTMDGDGELTGYRRIRRYNRSQTDED
jgi:gas vesicle protein GvpO